MVEQIDRDLQRTHPDKKFFSGETSFSRKNRVLHCLNPIFYFLFTCLWDFLKLTGWYDEFSSAASNEKYSSPVCKIESCNPLCARHEWGPGTNILCVQYWHRWEKCCKTSCRFLILIYLSANLFESSCLWFESVWGPKVTVLWIASLADSEKPNWLAEWFLILTVNSILMYGLLLPADMCIFFL